MAQKRAVRNAPIIAQLENIRAQHVADFHKPWPGAEFGKTLTGLAIDGAIAELERKSR